MKKLVFFLFLSIFLFNSVYALDCEYTNNNPYEKEVIVFYENSSKLDYNVLEVKDIIQGYGGSPYWSGAYPMSFKVYNNYNSEVNVTVKYLFNGALNSFDCPPIASDGYCTVGGPYSPDLDESSIYFVINSPVGLEGKKEIERFNNESCKKCSPPDEFICLNNGGVCNLSSQCGSGHCIRGYCSKSEVCHNKDCKCNLTTELQCPDNTGCVTIKSVSLGFQPICRVEECITGDINLITGLCASKIGDPCSKHWDCISGICNIAGFCDTKEIVPCEPYGKLNCNNISCLTPVIKKTGEAYMCDWECANGTRDCNGVCKAVSSKEVGQEYSCEWECKSNRFRDGKCLTPTWTIIVFFSLIFLIVGIAAFLIKKTNNDKYWNGRAKHIINQANKESEIIVSSAMKKQQEILQKLKDKENETNGEIKKLEKEIEEKKRLGASLGEISSLKNKVEEMKKDKEDEDEKMKKAVQSWQDSEKEYIKPFKIRGRGGEAWRNPNILNKYYPCYWHGNPEKDNKEIHKDIAEKEIFNFYKSFFEKNYPGKKFHNFLVHHIDKDPDNFDLKNLAVIDNHYSIEHSRIQKGDGDSGINELKRLNIKQPHIKELNY